MKDLVRRIFTRLGEAEARVYGVPLESVAFYEVGSRDAISDVSQPPSGCISWA